MPFFVGDALMAHAKAGCYRCERGDHLVDMDTLIEGEGALVLCRACIGDAAEAAGLHLNLAAVQEMQAEFQEERRQFSPDAVISLQIELDEVKTALSHEQLTAAALQDALTRVGKTRTTKPRERASK